MLKKGYSILLAFGLFLVGCGGSSDNAKNDENKDYGIMIQTKKKGDLLFDSAGKQVGDSFENASSFDTGVSIVENKKGEMGMVNTKGDMLVDFGEYKKISPLSYLYQATTEDGEDMLLDIKGEVITSLEDTEIDPYGLLAVQFKDKVVAYDESGNELISVKSKKDTEVAGDLAHGVGDKIGLLSVGKEAYVFDMNTGKKIDEFESDNFYEKITLLNDWLILSGDHTYKVYRDLKPVGEVKDECDYLSVEIDALVCKVGNSEYVLDDELKKDLLINDGKSIRYQTSKDYAESTGFLKDTTFYENGSAVKTISGLDFASSTRHMPFGLYPMDDGKNNTTIYNGKGEPISPTVYDFVDGFDAFGHAEVEVGDIRYIIDTKGKKVSDDFEEVGFIRWGEFVIFYVGNTATESVVYNTKMKELYRGDIVDLAVDNKIQNIAMIHGKNAKKESVVYNATTSKEVFRGEGSVSMNMTHFTVTNKEKTAYYTFDGVKFFEE